MKVKKISWENIILPHTVTFEDGTIVVYEWDSPELDQILRTCIDPDYSSTLST